MGDRQDRPSAGPLERATAFLRALAADGPGALADWAAASRPDTSWGRWVQAQGLAPYAYDRLRTTDSLAGLPDDVKALLRADYYQGIGLNTLQRQEVEQVLAALEDAGVETVLLKGTPLAYTVYDDPLCRFKGDLDVWIRFGQLPEATAAIQGAGYRAARNVERPPELTLLVGGEQQMVSDLPGTGLIELQWPAFRGEWVRHTTRIDHELVWARRMPVRIEGRAAYMMAPEDLLIHLCLHQAINHQFARPWLRNLLDVHLVIQRLVPDWQQVSARACSWRVSTVMWTVLSLTEELLGTAVPSEVMMALSPAAWRRGAIRRLRLERGLIEMSSGGYRHRRFLIQMLMIDRLQDAMRLVWRGMFPESTWLRARYGISTPGAMWRARLTHPWRLLLSARA